jgi:type I restriction enzyme S subunit
MAEWKTTKIWKFLKEREGRYDPTDSSIQSLKRLNKIDFSGEIHLSDKGSKTDMIIVEPGDLVISGINVSKGALAVYHGVEPITATIHYSSYIFDEDKINIEYFKRFLKSKSFVNALKEQVKGGIKTEIKSKHFLPLEIRLPDIDAQKEIVSFFNRIENEMTELSDEINQQQDYLEKIRQQVLQEAIEGKLTVEWRNKHPELISGENSASKLLTKIKAEKEKPLPSITDAEKPFELPDGWVWCRLGELLRISSGDGLTAKDMTKGGAYPVFGGNGINGYHDKFNVSKPSIVIGRVGALCGSVHVTPEHAWVTDNAFVAYYPEADINTQWLEKLLISLDLRNRARETAQPVISGKRVYPIIIGLPSRNEQQAIVERVDKLMTMIDELAKQVTERKDKSERLMQSVLREAFERKA